MSAPKIFEINRDVDDMDLSLQLPYTNWHPFTRYFSLGMGQEHYKLLAFLSKQCDKGDVIYDIGTHVGFSALALAYNRNVHVTTYDLVNHIQTNQITAKDWANIHFKIADCTQPGEIESFAKASIIFLDVDPHDGIQEPHIFQAIQNAGFRGLMLVDDIHLNEGMKKFWEWIPLKKYDITNYGHFSGTGVVVFDESAYDVHIG
jgi:hypothetical protein